MLIEVATKCIGSIDYWESLTNRIHGSFSSRSTRARLGTEDSNPARSLGLSTDRQKEPKTPPGRARFEDSASEEGTTGRTRARTSCPVQEPTGVSLDSG